MSDAQIRTTHTTAVTFMERILPSEAYFVGMLVGLGIAIEDVADARRLLAWLERPTGRMTFPRAALDDVVRGYLEALGE